MSGSTMANAMSNYQLGDLLGRGASGSVYRALNFLTGETVAIKSISLLTLAPAALPDIMSEIDLLKNLNHPNIVKYKGFSKDRENLFIILEYCENGSLQTILKKFGKFPESLVAVYISQVLEGLIYLHEQGVVHRDIKGANILTNKDGSVKLADFGVSSRAAGPLLEAADHEVVGSPYWMAPEVIEQSGASTASDIWSVGCVVVELLEGKPPYGNLAPMQALWRIVQDEGMKVPEGASPVVKDFLYHCFQKDPNMRVSAKKLLRHPWMASVRRSSPGASLAPVIDIPSSSSEAGPSNGHLSKPINRSTDGTSLMAEVGREERRGGDTLKAKKPSTVYDEAVQRVQEWNEALNASPKALGTAKRIPIAQRARRVSVRTKLDTPASLNIFALSKPVKSANDSITAHASSSDGSDSPLEKDGSIAPGSKPPAAGQSRSKLRESSGESWDDDFAADISLSKFKPKDESGPSEDHNQQTLKPMTSPPSVQVPSTSRPRPAKPGPSKRNMEDYSDMVDWDPANKLALRMANTKSKEKSQGRILRPDDLATTKSFASVSDRVSLSTNIPIASRTVTPMGPPPPPQRPAKTPAKIIPPPQRTSSTPGPIVSPLSRPSTSTPARLPSGSKVGRTPSSSSLAPPASPVPTRSPPSSRQNSMRGKQLLTESQRELHKYSEADNEDYDDMFDESVLQDDATLGLKQSQSLQLTKRSNHSWMTEEDEMDPFAEIDEDFSVGEDDLEQQLLRDKKATLCEAINRIIDVLEPSTSPTDLRTACDDLLGMLENTPDFGLVAHFLSSHGMMAILELLESRLSRDVTVRLLRIVNFIVLRDLDALESFCLIGGIPVIIPYTSKKHSLDTRLEASTFIQQLTQSALTLQMFISCRGLRILVELLDEDYSENRSLILSSLDGVCSVFDLQSPTPRNDFCRMFIREGILDPLSSALLAILKDDTIDGDGPVTRAIGVLLLFCQVAQADSRVRDAFASRTIIIRLLKACAALPRKLLVTAIKAIKHLSTSSQLIEVLQNSNAMETLVTLLGKNIKGIHSNEICSHIFQTIYSMTRLSKSRQEEAASSGIIPLLRRVIQHESPLKQFALPILCDIANAGKVSRRLLWQNDGMKLYLDLLQDPYWRVSALDAILAWMSDETARVEDVLLEKSAADKMIQAFVQASGVSFEGILDPLLKILRLSTTVTATLSTTSFIRRLSDALSHQHKAVVKLNLLRLTRVVCDNHPDRATLVARFDLAEIVDRLARQDEAILVREMAKEIHPTLIFGNTTEPKEPSPLTQSVTEPPSSVRSIRPIMQTTDIMSSAPEMMPIHSATSRVLNTMRRATSENGVLAVTETGTKTSKITPGREKVLAGVSPGRVSITPLKVEGDDRPQHKRKISRSQLKDLHWQADENGQLRSVRTPSRASRPAV